MSRNQSVDEAGILAMTGLVARPMVIGSCQYNDVDTSHLYDDTSNVDVWHVPLPGALYLFLSALAALAQRR